MEISLEAAICLLHQNDQATLASLSCSVPGYPFASALPFCVDESQAPLFLVSGLAEHTLNLNTDPRASVLIQTTRPAAPEASSRLTLVGDAFLLSPSPTLVRRYLRYHPGASRYLELGDFCFFRLEVRRARMIAGFGQVGWINMESWQGAPQLSLEDEETLLERCRPDLGLIGVDCFGADTMTNGARKRISFPCAVAPDEVNQALARLG